MIYEAENLNGTTVILNSPVSVSLSMDEDAPADSLKANFAVTNDPDIYKLIANDQLSKIKIYDDQKSRLIFNGLIDEQSSSISGNGLFINLVARSTASLLLDNEAKPQIYNSISTDILFNRHIKPYGFSAYQPSNNRRFNCLFEVNKGLSEWQVIENFCNDFLFKIPRVTPSNIINFMDDYNDSGVIFSNKDTDAIHYSSIEQSFKRFKLISEVFVRNKKDGGYDTKISDSISLNKNIHRRRYINAVGDLKSPSFRGQQLIKDANLSYFELKIKHPGPIVLQLLDKATVDDEILGLMPDLIASSINYSLGASSESCTITFRKEA